MLRLERPEMQDLFTVGDRRVRSGTCQVWGAGVVHGVVWMVGLLIQASVGRAGAVGGLFRKRLGLAW